MTATTTTARLLLLPGDGIGPEVMAEARRVLTAAGDRFGITFDCDERLIGGAAIDAYGVPLRDEEIDAARNADAILLGAVGGPKWSDPNAPVRPEQGLLKIRKALGLYANLRPVATLDALAAASPVKKEIVRGTDLVVVRELTGGLYFGRPSRQWHDRRGRVAIDTLIYREHEIARVARLAFDLAKQRKGKVTSVDKANVLSSSRLWRQLVTEIAADYPEVTLDHMLVDAATMHLIRNPRGFDVIVTENMFGDILTDEASVLAGSLGVLPSASLGDADADGRRRGLYEPIHGSAPDIAGQSKANPIGMILSAAMMLRTSLGRDDAATAIEVAVSNVLAAGTRTGDIAGDGPVLSTTQMGEAIAAAVATPRPAATAR